MSSLLQIILRLTLNGLKDTLSYIYSINQNLENMLDVFLKIIESGSDGYVPTPEEQEQFFRETCSPEEYRMLTNDPEDLPF